MRKRARSQKTRFQNPRHRRPPFTALFGPAVRDNSSTENCTSTLISGSIAVNQQLSNLPNEKDQSVAAVDLPCVRRASVAGQPLVVIPPGQPGNPDRSRNTISQRRSISPLSMTSIGFSPPNASLAELNQSPSAEGSSTSESASHSRLTST